MRLPSARWLIALLPLAVLVASFVQAPYITAVRDVGGALPPLPTAPAPLYKSASTGFFYTSADLIHPEAFAAPGFVEAVVFDIFPGSALSDGGATSNLSLTWTSRFQSAMAGEPRTSRREDDDLAAAFRKDVGGAAPARGQALLFEIPPASSYGRQSGVRVLAAVGTRPAPGADTNRTAVADNGSPQLLDEALDQAFRDLAARGVRGVGVPRMIVRERIGDAGTRAESWETILTSVDAAARGARLSRVVFGGWGIDPRARAATDAAFRDVWERRRRELAGESRQIADERTRVGALLAFAAVAGWIARGRSVHLSRLVALTMIAGTTALTIAALARWAGGLVSVTPAAVFALESALALAAGAAVEQLVQFDPRKKLAPPEPS